MLNKIADKMKEILYAAIIIALIAGAYAAISFVNAYSRSIQPSSFRSFSVSGEGKVIAIPDVAQFSFGVITQGGKDIAKIQKENADKINNAIAFLKSKNINVKDIKTQNYNLDPQYQYYNCARPESSVAPCPPPVIVGYTINQTVIVKIRDFSLIGDILSGVIKNGANSVSQLSFTIDDADSLKNQARAEAIEKAKEKAKSIADAGGFGLGQLISIEEGYNPLPMYNYATKGMGMSAAAGEFAIAPSIEAGSQEIIININLRYEIK